MGKRLLLAAAVLVAVSLILRSRSTPHVPDTAPREVTGGAQGTGATGATGGVAPTPAQPPSRPATPQAAAAPSPAAPPSAEDVHYVGVTNSAGRSGAYYLPPAAARGPVPLLVLLHPTGGSGRSFIPAFLALAAARGFAIVAPDSRVAPGGIFTWEVGDKPGEVTPDMTHTMAVLDWVETQAHLRIDPSRVLIAGFSGGGSSAPWVATNRTPFTHAAVLHGRVFPGGLGSRRVHMWFSTGSTDTFASTTEMGPLVDEVRRRSYDVTYRVYPGGHGLGKQEKEELIRWWLGS